MHIPTEQTHKNIRPAHTKQPKAASHQSFLDQRPELAVQRRLQDMANAAVQRKENKTGMPDQLKSGIEGLSGMDMSDVRVHYNSSKPAAVQAHAYTQGSQIHVASGQEKHLAHEAWHVVQQKQGRVQATTQVSGMPVNDSASLEKEADAMGAKALQAKSKENAVSANRRKNGVVDNALAQKKSNVKQGFGFVDNRQGAKQARNPENPTAQLMILPLWDKTKKDKDKFLDEGNKKGAAIGEKNINISNFFSDNNLKNIPKDEDLHIIAHGSQVRVAGETPESLAKHLVKNLKLPKEYDGHIFLEACKTGVDLTQEQAVQLNLDVASFAKKFSIHISEMLGRDIRVDGYKGAVIWDDEIKKTLVVKPGNNYKEVMKEETNEWFENLETMVFKIADTEGFREYLDHAFIEEKRKTYMAQVRRTITDEVGGQSTVSYRNGTEVYNQLIPAAEAISIEQLLNEILKKAREEKAEIDNIPVKELNLGGLVVIKN